MEHADVVRRYLCEPGVEIGAFKSPIPGIKPIYVDRFAEFANEKTLADYYGDACDLPFEDSTLNYVASSHLIEHAANPLAALQEWYRVLRHGGIIYMVVPHRQRTFDHPRELTPPAHMIDDYRDGVTQVDGTHIEDFVFGVDWLQYSPSTLVGEIETQQRERANTYRAAIKEGKEINIHFHTFEPESMVELLTWANEVLPVSGRIELIDVIDHFPASTPNGFLVVSHVSKSLLERAQSFHLPWKKGALLKSDARPLHPSDGEFSAEWVEFVVAARRRLTICRAV